MKGESVVKFLLTDRGSDCEIETREMIIVPKLSIGANRSVVSIRSLPKDNLQVYLERVVLEDGHIWAEHPVCLEISGAGIPSHADSTVRSFQAFYAVLEEGPYECPIRGEIHYQTIQQGV